MFPPADKANRARLRIFTPARELPFAGHPTVGTAVLLARLDGGAAERTFVLEEKVGLVLCRVKSSGADSGRAAFDIPRLPERRPTCPTSPRWRRARPEGRRHGLDGFAAARWSAGNPFTCWWQGLDAIGRIRLDLARFDQAFGGGDHAAAFIFCRETAEAGNPFHARMFAPVMGVHEDPATAWRVAAFAGYLAAAGGYPDGVHVVGIEQGYEWAARARSSSR